MSCIQTTRWSQSKKDRLSSSRWQYLAPVKYQYLANWPIYIIYIDNRISYWSKLMRVYQKQCQFNWPFTMVWRHASKPLVGLSLKSKAYIQYARTHPQCLHSDVYDKALILLLIMPCKNIKKYKVNARWGAKNSTCFAHQSEFRQEKYYCAPEPKYKHTVKKILWDNISAVL